MKFILLTFVIIQAYFQLASSQKISACYWSPGNTDFSQFDINLCSFIYVTPFVPVLDGPLYVPDASPLFAYKKQNPHLNLKVFATIVDSIKPGYFATIGSDTEKLIVFMNQCLELPLKGYDGINIQWEYPVTTAEKQALQNIANILYPFLKFASKLLVVTVSGKASIMQQGNEIFNLNNRVNYLNLNAFDLSNSDATTALNTGYSEAEAAVNRWIAGNFDASKILLGVTPNYKCYYLENEANFGVGASASPVTQCPYEGVCGGVEPLENFTSDQAPVYYTYRFWISGENPASVAAKMNIVTRKNLAGGYMAHSDISGQGDDYLGQCGLGTYPLTTALADALKARRFACPPVTVTTAYPHLYDCKRFYTCSPGLAAVDSACLPGLAFSRTRNRCTFIFAVPGCF